MSIKLALILSPLISYLGGEAPNPEPVHPALQTEPVRHDPDDPAIWVHPTQPEQSLILGTDKKEKEGALYVFDLAGKTLQIIPNLDRPNNVDVIENFQLGGKQVGLVALTERRRHRLRLFAIDPQTRKLSDVSGVSDVFVGDRGADSEPMGIALGRFGGRTYAFVSPKWGQDGKYLGQFELTARQGKVDVREIRRFGRFSGLGEIEALAVNHRLNQIISADEEQELWAHSINPLHFGPLTAFGKSGYLGQREGLAFYHGTRSLLLSADQIPVHSRLHVYDAVTKTRLGIIPTKSDSTDGIEATSRPLGARFPKGIVVMMNDQGKNFLIYDWRDLQDRLQRVN